MNDDGTPNDDVSSPASVSPRGPTGDEDRRAILERRQRFIALALAGLASSCGRSREPASAVPSAEPDAAEPGATEGEPADTDGSGGVDPADRPPPRKPKEYARPRIEVRGRAPARPCLRVALPEEDEP